MKIGYKIVIIIVSSHISLFLAFFLPFLIFNIISENKHNDFKNSICDTLEKYNRSDNMILYYDQNIYNNNAWNKTEESICWIDEENIIYYRYNDIINYYLVNKGETIILNENIRLNIFIDSFIYKDLCIYYCDYSKSYYKFDTISKDNISISKEDYYIVRNGNKYIVDDSNIKNGLKIINSENNISRIINNQINSNALIKELKEKEAGKFFETYYYNYYIINDSIYYVINALIFDDSFTYGSLLTANISLIFSYDFQYDSIELYNWILLNDEFEFDKFPYAYSLFFC